MAMKSNYFVFSSILNVILNIYTTIDERALNVGKNQIIIPGETATMRLYKILSANTRPGCSTVDSN